MNEPYIPLGWPSGLELDGIAQGVDVGWPFELILRVPPRQIRELYGTWRHPSTGPAKEAYFNIPSLAMEMWSVAKLDKAFPRREWVCPLRVMVVGIEDARRLGIYTMKYATENRIFEGFFRTADDGGAHGLRQLLTQFANSVGAGP